MATIFSVLFLISLAGVIYPFRPFRKRRYALLIAIASFIGAGATAPQNEPSTGITSKDTQITSKQDVVAKTQVETRVGATAPQNESSTGMASKDAQTISNEDFVADLRKELGMSADSNSTFSRQCASAEATGVEYGVTGSRINVRNGPGTNYEKIINRKATNALGETRYVQIDNSVTVHEVCRKGDWSLIEVVKPDWLRDSHRGWVASRFLRGQMRDSAGVQVFTKEDFVWDKNTSPYKDTIVAAVNKIHRENARCKEIDPSSAYLSGSKSSPGNPVFFVTCGSGANAFNVWFSKDDLDSEKPSETAEHIDKATSISDSTRQQLWILRTQDGVKQRLKDPSSAEFRNSRFVDFEGVPIVCGEVNAKNSFGGYGGFQHFIASGTKLAFLEQDMEPSEFGTAWNKMCAGR